MGKLVNRNLPERRGYGNEIRQRCTLPWSGKRKVPPINKPAALFDQ
jgi:hypothetical protein